MEIVIDERITGRPLAGLTDAEWETASKRYAIIAPLLNDGLKSVNITEAAKAANVNRRTLYRWIDKYMEAQSVSSLTDNKRSGGEGKALNVVAANVEEIVAKVINDRYLNKQKLTIRKISIEIALQCREAGLVPPHYTTVKRRIDQITNEEKLAKRSDRSIARKYI